MLKSCLGYGSVPDPHQFCRARREDKFSNGAMGALVGLRNADALNSGANYYGPIHANDHGFRRCGNVT